MNALLKSIYSNRFRACYGAREPLFGRTVFYYTLNKVLVMSRVSSDKPRDKWDCNVVAVVVLLMVSYSLVG